MGTRRIGRGHVEEFDEHVGLGVVLADSGDRLGFHCTAIADGSRSIDVGTPVVFREVSGHLGRREAAEVTPSR